MTAMEPLYTLAEAAAALQVTSADARNPERWVRDKVRTLRLPFVKAGRTVKLPLSTVEALRQSMLVVDPVMQVRSIDLPSVRGELSATSKEVIARLEALKAARKASRQ